MTEKKQQHQVDSSKVEGLKIDSDSPEGKAISRLAESSIDHELPVEMQSKGVIKVPQPTFMPKLRRVAGKAVAKDHDRKRKAKMKEKKRSRKANRK